MMFEYFGQTLDTIIVVAKIIWRFAPVWLPIALVSSSWRQWVGYRRAGYIAKQEPVLLEIRVPKEVSKSPAAMTPLNHQNRSSGRGGQTLTEGLSWMPSEFPR